MNTWAQTHLSRIDAAIGKSEGRVVVVIKLLGGELAPHAGLGAERAGQRAGQLADVLHADRALLGPALIGAVAELRLERRQAGLRGDGQQRVGRQGVQAVVLSSELVDELLPPLLVKQVAIGQWLAHGSRKGERAHSLLHQRHVRRLFGGHGGQVLARVGDGVPAAPPAHHFDELLQSQVELERALVASHKPSEYG